MRLKVPSSEFGTKELVDLQGWYKRTRRKIRRMIGSNRSTGGIGRSGDDFHGLVMEFLRFILRKTLDDSISISMRLD